MTHSLLLMSLEVQVESKLCRFKEKSKNKIVKIESKIGQKSESLTENSSKKSTKKAKSKEKSKKNSEQKSTKNSAPKSILKTKKKSMDKLPVPGSGTSGTSEDSKQKSCCTIT